MKRELQYSLLIKYHVFFDWLKEDKSELIKPMQFGIECGDGWYWILDNLMSSILHYQKCNSHRKGNDKFIRVRQIKEKFGRLEFYFSGGDDLIEGMVWLATQMSYKTCEYCGSTENVGRTKGWISVVCKTCHNKSTRLGYKEWIPIENNDRLIKLVKIKKIMDKQ